MNAAVLPLPVLAIPVRKISLEKDETYVITIPSTNLERLGQIMQLESLGLESV